jgi:hypothetical protein
MSVAVSALPPASSLTGTEQVPIVQSSLTVRTTVQDIVNVASETPVNLATGVTGTLTLTNGGTGQTTAAAARNALLPSQATHSGEVLTTDGTNVSWAAAGGGFQVAYGTFDNTGAAITTAVGITSVSFGGGNTATVNFTAAHFTTVVAVMANTLGNAGTVSCVITLGDENSCNVTPVDGFGTAHASAFTIFAIGS